MLSEPSLPSFAVTYHTGSKILRFYMPQMRGRKMDRKFFRFLCENVIKIYQENKTNSVIYNNFGYYRDPGDLLIALRRRYLVNNPFRRLVCRLIMSAAERLSEK